MVKVLVTVSSGLSLPPLATRGEILNSNLGMSTP